MAKQPVFEWRDGSDDESSTFRVTSLFWHNGELFARGRDSFGGTPMIEMRILLSQSLPPKGYWKFKEMQ